MAIETLSVIDVLFQNPIPTSLSFIVLVVSILLIIYFYKRPEAFNRFERGLSAINYVSVRVVFMINLVMTCWILFYGVLTMAYLSNLCSIFLRSLN